jgi:hypothetical protein
LKCKKLSGVKYISALLEEKEDRKDLWLVFQLGGQSLNKGLCDVKGEFYKGERIYKVNHGPLYFALK